MSREQDFIRILKAHFPNRVYPDCLDSSGNRESLVIEDQANCSRLTDFDIEKGWKYKSPKDLNVVYGDDSDILGFFIHNPSRRKVWLLSVDQCFFKDDEQSRCDCLVFNGNYLCFVELKLDVKGSAQSTAQLKKAREQLEKTIHFFKLAIEPSSSKWFGLIPEAYAVLPPSVALPTYPRFQVKRQKVFIEFLESTGVRLVEANAKEM